MGRDTFILYFSRKSPSLRNFESLRWFSGRMVTMMTMRLSSLQITFQRFPIVIILRGHKSLDFFWLRGNKVLFGNVLTEMMILCFMTSNFRIRENINREINVFRNSLQETSVIFELRERIKNINIIF